MRFLFRSQPDFACNSYALWRYIVKHTNHQTAWLIYKEERYKELKARGIECSLYDTYAGNKLVEESDYIIANSYTFKNLNKREGQVFVNLWHGSGIKAHDFFDRNSDVAYLKNIKTYFDKVDMLCVHSLDDRFKLSAQLNYDMRNTFVTGQPRLDCVVEASGKEKLVQIFGEEIKKYDYLFFYAPSFRANGSGCAGTMLSDNIFRLKDYDDHAFEEFLKENNAALIYKLHPIEQNAFKGRKFIVNKMCMELTDQILFEKELQYDEILNAFDVMITDYSSIAFDYLLLNRPIIYLLPDFDEYKKSKGFVFNNIDYYMPGDKVFDFKSILLALKNSIEKPYLHKVARENVLMQRFDYTDGKAAERCYKAIMEYEPIKTDLRDIVLKTSSEYPTAADCVKKYINNNLYEVLDGTRVLDSSIVEKIIKEKQAILIIEEKYDENIKLSQLYRGKTYDQRIVEKYKDVKNMFLEYVSGGVDYKMFSEFAHKTPKDRRIGFAGSIDSRIYFAMVQVICEALPDYEVIFAGEIIGDYPAWLDSFKNLRYIEATYEKLPEIISTFEVCLLPFYGKHQETVPSELLQYMAEGKCVVASDMRNIPKCNAIHTCKSIDESIYKLREIFKNKNNKDMQLEEMKIAQRYDWKNIAQELLEKLSK